MSIVRARDEQPGPETPEPVDAEAAEAAAAERYAQFTQASGLTGSLVDARLFGERNENWSAYPRLAAGHIMDVLSGLVPDDDFWQDLHRVEQALGRATPELLADVSEILEIPSDLFARWDSSRSAGSRPGSYSLAPGGPK